MIKNKLVEGTSDEICQECSQSWEDECRAFVMSHSEEEFVHRNKDHTIKCLRLIVDKITARARGS